MSQTWRGWRAVRRAGLAGVAVAATLGCAGRKEVDPGVPAPPRERGTPSALDVVRLYRQVGLVAESAPVPFVGATHALATETPDSTLVLLTLSLPNRALTFARESDHYRAAYDILLDVRRGALSVRRTQGRQTVRVASYKETSRGDESLIFQQFVRLAPGVYTVAMTLRDAESGREATREFPLTAPRIPVAGLSSAIPVYEAEPRLARDTLPILVPNPRATAIFGQDSTIAVYVELYGRSGPLQAMVHDASGAALWRDSVALPSSGAVASGMVVLPLADIGPGVHTFAAWTGADTTRSPLVISFGDGLAITAFDEMISYLRYFGSPERLAALRTAPTSERGRAWLTFLRESDPEPGTPEHEGLRDYFVRVEQANLRYREDAGSGWLSDRGRVFITLGDPDQVYEQSQSDISTRGRVQVWEYAQYRVQLVFVDQSGFGRFRLTTSSEAEFNALARRLQRR